MRHYRLNQAGFQVEFQRQPVLTVTARIAQTAGQGANQRPTKSPFRQAFARAVDRRQAAIGRTKARQRRTLIAQLTAQAGVSQRKIKRDTARHIRRVGMFHDIVQRLGKGDLDRAAIFLRQVRGPQPRPKVDQQIAHGALGGDTLDSDGVCHDLDGSPGPVVVDMAELHHPVARGITRSRSG